MGPIQSSLNHLMGTAWGTVASAALAAKKFLPKKVNSKQEKTGPTTETSSGMGNIVKLERVPRNKYMKATAYLSADNAIDEKASSVTFSVDDRIALASKISTGGKK